MTIVLDLIRGAMKDIGAIAINEAPTAYEAQDGLEALTQMLSLWQTESLITYAMTQAVFTYPVTGSQTYTIGPTGDFVMGRPIRIDAAYNRDANDNDYFIYVARSFTDYSDIITKQVAANLVSCVYYDPTYPNGTLHLWPVPNDSSYRLVLWVWQSVSDFTSVDQTVSLPPGYELAIRTNLAMQLCPRYGKTPSPELAQMAVTSKAQIQRTNVQLPTMGFDLALGKSGIAFNYLTGQPT